MLNNKFVKLLVCLVLFFPYVQARYVHIKHEEGFDKEINNTQFVLACFLNNFENNDDKALQKDNSAMRKIIKAAAITEPFNKLLKQEVSFLVVDMEKGSIQALGEKYNISMNGKPECLLFKDGKQVHQDEDQQAKLTGFVSKADLLDFINDYFGKEFDDILEKKSQEQAQDREMQLARYQAIGASRYPYGSWAPYNPWGSPAAYIYTGYAAFYPYGYSYNGYAYFIP